MSVGDIFCIACIGAEAALKNASNGSVISSLSRLRFLRMGTIMAILITLLRVVRGSGSLRRRIRLVGRVPGRLRKPKPLSVRFSLYETVIKRCISTVKQRVLKVTVSSTSECESGDARNPRPRVSPAAPAFPHVYLGPPKRIPLATSLSCRCSLGMKEKDRRRGCRSRSSNDWLSLDGSGFSGNSAAEDGCEIWV